MGHRDVKTTLTVYAHLINTDDHTGNMAALGALAAPARSHTAATSFNCMGSERWLSCVRAVLVRCFHNLRIPRRIFMKGKAVDRPRLSLGWTMLTLPQHGVAHAVVAPHGELIEDLVGRSGESIA